MWLSFLNLIFYQTDSQTDRHMDKVYEEVASISLVNDSVDVTFFIRLNLLQDRHTNKAVYEEIKSFLKRF